MNEGAARARFGEARVARLATVTAEGRPHVVPIVFALDGDTIVWAVDDKPKRSLKLKRLDNIRTNPAVEAVADGFSEDWMDLWWVRASGMARIVLDPAERDGAVALLQAKYWQYRDRPPSGPVVAIDVDRWSGWAAS